MAILSEARVKVKAVVMTLLGPGNSAGMLVEQAVV